jgi:hypothetical protein
MYMQPEDGKTGENARQFSSVSQLLQHHFTPQHVISLRNAMRSPQGSVLRNLANANQEPLATMQL